MGGGWWEEILILGGLISLCSYGRTAFDGTAGSTTLFCCFFFFFLLCSCFLLYSGLPRSGQTIKL
ncbi:hypothetical protein F5144DRAFT_558168 [Chaetomium tenue]|uniref:Uncharacterized protein n=1 Tax=Chaetomium tenue TaxID=1854479 RepID=A0ACB7PSS8_9PEZI|nr:hypothetical protein F5144DRAFT_558168 [Chaetomium globosum]